MESNNNMSRRHFMGLTGGVAGLAALASMGINSGWSKNDAKLTKDDITLKEHDADVLVIGGGMAGLFAAVKARDAGAKVILVSKGRLGASGQTPFAKGIFEYDAKTAGCSVDEFAEMVGKSAMGTNNPVYTRQVAEHSQARVKDLREWGFFDSSLCNKSFMKPMNERNIPVIERVTITHLIKDKGRVIGAAGFSIDEKKSYFFNAKSVILCTGAGGFKPNGFPICDLTHDGTVMAYNIGAMVTGKEWNDGHLGQAENSAACYDGWHGMFDRKPSTTSVSVRHDLGVELNYAAYTGGSPVEMGGPSSSNNTSAAGGPYRPAGFSEAGGGDRERPDMGERPSKGEGHPPRGEGGPPKGDRPEGGHPGGDGPEGGPPQEGGKEGGGAPPGMGGSLAGGSSAGMSIHKSEGLVPINDKCESTIPGLYAAGDALGSYMAGAIYTQIGSSLAGSAVQGAIAGEAAAFYAKQTTLLAISKVKKSQVEDEIFAPLKRESGYSPAWVTQTLQGIMIPNFILYVKKESLMRAALAYVEELRDHHIPMLRASDLHELRLVHETVNMVISAEMKLRASLMRTESRCTHYRLDYPNPDFENWQAWLNIYKADNGSMQFEKQPFSDWK